MRQDGRIDCLDAAQVQAIQSQYNCTVLAAQYNQEAIALVGGITDEVAVQDAEGRRYTLYISWEAGKPTLEWDVSGWPSWYTPKKEGTA